MSDKSANFPAIYHNILKHVWNLSFAWLPWNCHHVIDRFRVCWFASLPLSVPHYWSLFTTWFTLFVVLLHIARFRAFFCAGFTLFCCVVIHCHNQAFHFTLLIFHVRSRLLSLICYSVMVGFALFVFVRHTAHCFLLLVNCMLCG